MLPLKLRDRALGKTQQMEVRSDMTVSQLREMIKAGSVDTLDDLQLQWKGEVLANDTTLAEIDIQPGDTIDIYHVQLSIMVRLPSASTRVVKVERDDTAQSILDRVIPRPMSRDMRLEHDGEMLAHDAKISELGLEMGAMVSTVVTISGGYYVVL